MKYIYVLVILFIIALLSITICNLEIISLFLYPDIYKKQFVQVKKSMDLPFESLAKESIGLSFADIEKVTTDFIKDILVYGLDNADVNEIFEYIKVRKVPY